MKLLSYFQKKKEKKRTASCCHGSANQPSVQGAKKIALVGHPNVGKSVIFNQLTGNYVVVSNYPGTTVEVSRGVTEQAGEKYEVIDTPGMYSLLSITEEEKVARDILFQERPDVILHVIDAKNLARMLPFTLQLLELNLPVILVLNMMDELAKRGQSLDIACLSQELNIPVVPVVATSAQGIDQLKAIIKDYDPEQQPGYKQLSGDFSLEEAVQNIVLHLKNDYPFSKRTMGLYLLQGEEYMFSLLQDKEAAETCEAIGAVIEAAKANYTVPLDFVLAQQRQQQSRKLVDKILRKAEKEKVPFREKLSRLTINPWTGLPLLLLILYWGLYKFVGEFGAGTLVDFLESTVFETYVNPFMVKVFTTILPWPIIQDLFVGEYGILTLGLRYAIAIILPIVTLFFMMFAVLEDTGYLPRLAMLIDRLFKKIGLSGRAVIPMVLGLGCDTMATLVTRTLPTKRERVISTVLLSLAIPCSAQLGVILALLGGNSSGLLTWTGVLILVFLVVGFLTAKLLPGSKPVFYMELPPLRLPKVSNVLVKTYSRVHWYLKEIVPVFLIASLLIWVGKITGLFDILINLFTYPVKLIGLPADTAPVFLFGFFRRDYGAAGLYDLQKAGLLTGNQLVVACVAITLFLPCVAQLLINIKERGIKTGLLIATLTLFFSFGVAFLLNTAFNLFGVRL